MKKIILIIASIVYFSSSNELHEILRLPLLLEHYARHRLEDPGLSLLDFLKIHYAMDHPNDKDDKEDNELPFKSKGSLIHIDAAFAVERIVFGEKIFSAAKEKMTGYTEPIPDHTSHSIFHPPRQT